MSAPVVAAPAVAPSHVIDEKERVDLEQTENVRLSLPTESDRQAWESPGLRVSIGYGTGAMRGFGPAWSFSSSGVTLRPMVRIDRHWGLGVSMFYGSAPNGVRWSVTAEPTLYLWRQLAVSVGLGFGGLTVSDFSIPSLGFAGREVVSRDVIEGEKLSSCEGSAATSVLRAEYLFVVGALFATGPYLQGNAQWTRCQQRFGPPDPETGVPVSLTQWWRQAGWTAGWWFVWR
jgi:hypothetical protein